MKDAKALSLPDSDGWYDDYRGLLYDFSTTPPTYIACDGMEPEDVMFPRDLRWVPTLLNKLHEENVALRELYEANHG